MRVVDEMNATTCGRTRLTLHHVSFFFVFLGINQCDQVRTDKRETIILSMYYDIEATITVCRELTR